MQSLVMLGCRLPACCMCNLHSPLCLGELDPSVADRRCVQRWQELLALHARPWCMLQQPFLQLLMCCSICVCIASAAPATVHAVSLVFEQLCVLCMYVVSSAAAAVCADMYVWGSDLAAVLGVSNRVSVGLSGIKQVLD